jgi:hypothetical protein
VRDGVSEAVDDGVSVVEAVGDGVALPVPEREPVPEGVPEGVPEVDGVFEGDAPRGRVEVGEGVRELDADFVDDTE